MENKSKLSRRNFVGTAAAGAAALTVVPGFNYAANAGTTKVRLGYIGTGIQSHGLLTSINKCPETVVLACCDVVTTKVEKFRKEAQALNDKKWVGENHQVTSYGLYRELLERKDIDAVVIATPDHWHAQIAVDAAKAGKDIYCEKPMALTVAEGRAMVNATRKYKRVFQTGNMQRSWRNFRHACELVQNGYIGEIKEINVSVGPPVKALDLPGFPTPETVDWDMWLGPSLYREYSPVLSPPVENPNFPMWRSYREFGGGMITDWGAHMFDIAQWAMGMDESGPVEFTPPAKHAVIGLQMKYKNGVVLNHKNWIDSGAVQFIGTKGKIEVSRSFLRSDPAEVVATEIKATDKHLYKSDDHYQDWIEAIKKRSRPISDVETGHRTASLCNIANIAYELQRPLKWDPKKEQFIGDAAANMMLTRAYRGQWNFLDF
ncbi:MAG: Gfo/Idh/MocA family oxidoreductase [Bacteroidia bacterium]|nr:Gfo/Idh/MocA family oxidoreductase [Bacteroidia bacterium]